MQLTLYSDYSLRVLIYLARHRDGLITINEIAEFYQISKNHLVKVVHQLGKIGVIESVRGKNGGLRLALAPEKIYIGDLVQKTEPNFNLVECFNFASNRCVITDACYLKNILDEGLRSMMKTLNQYTLADVITRMPNAISVL